MVPGPPGRQHGTMRTESSVTSLSWIPSEAVRGGTRVAFDAGFTHYDEPPPDVIDDLEALRQADRFRFANVLSAWAEWDARGTVTDCGYTGGGLMGSTTVAVGGPQPRVRGRGPSGHPAAARGGAPAGCGSSRRPGDAPDSPPPAGSAASRSSSGRPPWSGPP